MVGCLGAPFDLWTTSRGRSGVLIGGKLVPLGLSSFSLLSRKVITIRLVARCKLTPFTWHMLPWPPHLSHVCHLRMRSIKLILEKNQSTIH